MPGPAIERSERSRASPSCVSDINARGTPVTITSEPRPFFCFAESWFNRTMRGFWGTTCLILAFTSACSGDDTVPDGKAGASGTSGGSGGSTGGMDARAEQTAGGAGGADTGSPVADARDSTSDRFST